MEIAELGIKMAKGPIENYTSLASKVYIRPEFQEIAQDYLDPLRRCEIDTLVLGCTHFPLLKALIGSVVGHNVVLISSATETARDCCDLLTRQGACSVLLIINLPIVLLLLGRTRGVPRVWYACFKVSAR